MESNEVSITSLDMIQRCLEEGEARRHIGETDMNKRSSRSHTIFRITIESRSSQELEKEFEEGKTEEESGYSALVATLNLVDLAGSESVRVTNAVSRQRRKCSCSGPHRAVLVAGRKGIGWWKQGTSTSLCCPCPRSSKTCPLVKPPAALETANSRGCCSPP